MSLNMMADDVGELAKQQGVACLALTNMHHFAALWPEMELMTQQGLVAMTMTSAFPIVPPPGGAKPLFGTNPIAFGWPRDNGEAVLVDFGLVKLWDPHNPQTTAAIARGFSFTMRRRRLKCAILRQATNGQVRLHFHPMAFTGNGGRTNRSSRLRRTNSPSVT